MSKFNDTFRIESARLREWDYSNPWWYYVTINTKNHIPCFGDIIKRRVILNRLGMEIENIWKNISNHFPNVELDYFIVMPNHIHGIIILNQTVETRHASSLRHKNITVSDVVGSFKSAVTKFAHEIGYKRFSWQPRFFDRLIRNEKELFNIRNYIEQNPLKWDIEHNEEEIDFI